MSLRPRRTPVSHARLNLLNVDEQSQALGATPSSASLLYFHSSLSDFLAEEWGAKVRQGSLSVESAVAGLDIKLTCQVMW